MPQIDLIQGSPEWISYRQSKIMATDTPVLLGSNHFRTRFELWQEKLNLRPAQEMNDAMRQGQIREPIARALAIERLGINFTPIVYESDEFPWMASSLDGISDCGRFILELKCPSKRKLYEQVCDKFIPAYYEDQMQHQLSSHPRAEQVIYGVYFEENDTESIMFLDRTLNIEKKMEIIEIGYEFYKRNMCNFEAPVEWKLKERK